MILSVHQPQYIPWIGFFHKMINSDVFVFLDDVQYIRREFKNRNKIKTPNGAIWLTVPVSDDYKQKICDIRIDNTSNWNEKHTKTIEHNYKRAPFFKEFYPVILNILAQEWKSLSELNIAIIREIFDYLGVEMKFYFSSEMALRETPNERIIDICKLFSADTYLSGRDGANYMDLEEFREEVIQVEFQNFVHPIYPQLFGDFIPYMSAIDLIFNCGKESLKIMKGE